MRLYRYILFLAVLVWSGCEVIKEEDRFIPVEEETSGGRRHVLIEYTGFRCVNCPTAAEQASALQGVYGERLIVVALHPASNPFTQGKYDYTCPAADSIYRWMGGTASTPFPTGNIDMHARSERWFFDPAEWPAEVSLAMEDTIAPPLSLTVRTDTATLQINIDAQYAAYTDCRLTFWLVEDSVQGAQAMPDGTVNMNYYHRHVLRTVSDEPILPLPDGCHPEHCSVVALMIDTNDQHIIQAYETKLDNDSILPSGD